jgi:predicted GNAT family N-acyltransferase
MNHEQRHFRGRDAKPTGFWPGILGEEAQAAARARHDPAISIETADIDELKQLLTSARAGLALADDVDLLRMLEKNPTIARVIRATPGGAPVGMLAFMPLNEFGAGCITRGYFDGAQPDPAWITRPGEVPAAIYHWLIYAPGKYLASLDAIGGVYRALAPDGCPLFTRGATAQSDAMHRWLGFRPAGQLYPEAADWLLVALPEKGANIAPFPAPRRIEIRQVRSFEELAHVVSIRSATYLAEQFPLYAEEFDGNDFCATHLVGYVDGDPAGAIRMRYFGDFAKVERLAVKLEYRKSRLAFRLVKEAVAHVRRKGFTRVYGHASDEVAPFWRLLGASDMADRPEFRFANVVYREMSAELEPDPLAIRCGVQPLMSIRPEGKWDEPGALDMSNLSTDSGRETLLRAHSRAARS